MYIKFFCCFLDASSPMPIRLSNNKNLMIDDLMIAVYKKYKKTFKNAKVNFCELQFFALVHPTSIWDTFLKVICYLVHLSNHEPPRNAGWMGHGRIDER